MKLKTHFTPGPWHAVQIANWWNIQSGPMYGDTDLFNEEQHDEAAANAQLAKAAPELYLACKAMEKADHNSCYWSNSEKAAYAEVIAAIAKAEGTP